MIVDQGYWDASYAQHVFARVPPQDSTRRLLQRLIPRAAPGQTAFEIGCFPGRYLLEIGHLGYRVNGCDTTPRVDAGLGPWLQAQGISVGTLVRADVGTLEPSQYDLVASFGFVEHFTEFRAVFRRHFDFVRPGGLVWVSFPNFGGAVQCALHQFLDRDNLARHVRPAMRLAAYQQEAERLGTVLFAGPYGGFDFWHDERDERIGPLRRQLRQAIYLTRWAWPLIPTASPWAPYAAILVRAHT